MKKVLILIGILVLLCGCSRKNQTEADAETTIETITETIDDTIEAESTAAETAAASAKDLKSFYGEKLQNILDTHENEIPVRMDYQESYNVVEDITDTELIKKVYTALMGIQIGEETDKSITDAERNYWFTYADGTEIGFPLIKADKDMMIYGPDGQQLYVITDDNGLFGISIF